MGIYDNVWVWQLFVNCHQGIVILEKLNLPENCSWIVSMGEKEPAPSCNDVHINEVICIKAWHIHISVEQQFFGCRGNCMWLMAIKNIVAIFHVIFRYFLQVTFHRSQLQVTQYLPQNSIKKSLNSANRTRQALMYIFSKNMFRLGAQLLWPVPVTCGMWLVKVKWPDTKETRLSKKAYFCLSISDTKF